MNHDLTDISILLDRTGSMGTIKHDVIGGFNGFISEQRAAGGECSLSLVQFDSREPHEVIHSAAPLAEVDDLNDRTFRPRAMTTASTLPPLFIGRIHAEPEQFMEPTTAADGPVSDSNSANLRCVRGEPSYRTRPRSTSRSVVPLFVRPQVSRSMCSSTVSVPRVSLAHRTMAALASVEPATTTALVNRRPDHRSASMSARGRSIPVNAHPSWPDSATADSTIHG